MSVARFFAKHLVFLALTMLVVSFLVFALNEYSPGDVARKRERWGEAMREHEMILDALRRRAGGELSDILFHHLRNKRTAAIEHLSEVGEPAKSAKPAAAETAS